ncbi:hypothetical protein ACFPRL_11665 [Pseudoclavibacter helvolus]
MARRRRVRFDGLDERARTGLLREGGGEQADAAVEVEVHGVGVDERGVEGICDRVGKRLSGEAVHLPEPVLVDLVLAPVDDLGDHTWLTAVRTVEDRAHACVEFGGSDELDASGAREPLTEGSELFDVSVRERQRLSLDDPVRAGRVWADPAVFVDVQRDAGAPARATVLVVAEERLDGALPFMAGEARH